MTTRRKIYLLITLSAIALYIGSYVIFSAQGEYVPGCIGICNVKQYAWAPRNFVTGPDGTQWDFALLRVYLPLWWLDYHYFHTPDGAYEANMPVNKTLENEFEKVRQQIGIGTPLAERPSHTTDRTDRVTSGSAAY